MYTLLDLWPALGDFARRLSHRQHHGCWISRGCPNVGFDRICIWYRFKVQLRSAHDELIVEPAQTVQALPPSQEYLHGKCDTVLFHGREAGYKSIQGESTLLFAVSVVPISDSCSGQDAVPADFSCQPLKSVRAPSLLCSEFFLCRKEGRRRGSVGGA